jgi:hypothetical protein
MMESVSLVVILIKESWFMLGLGLDHLGSSWNHGFIQFCLLWSACMKLDLSFPISCLFQIFEKWTHLWAQIRQAFCWQCHFSTAVMEDPKDCKGVAATFWGPHQQTVGDNKSALLVGIPWCFTSRFSNLAGNEGVFWYKLVVLRLVLMLACMRGSLRFVTRLPKIYFSVASIVNSLPYGFFGMTWGKSIHSNILLNPYVCSNIDGPCTSHNGLILVTS